MPVYKKCKFHLSWASFPLPGALFRPPSLHQTYETCIFVPQKIGTYIRWLPWWLLFIRILPLRVPSQHWWYPNPVPRFGFLASWSQIPTQVLLYLGFILNSLDITVSISVEKYKKLQLAAQRILDSKSPTIIPLFSFWVVHQNFEIMIGLSYRFIRNLYVRVFWAYKTGIMTTSNDFTTYLLVQVGVVKNFV